VCVKCIDENGRTNAVCAYFIEWFENLQERLLGAGKGSWIDG
jgi:hypothetical protein